MPQPPPNSVVLRPWGMSAAASIALHAGAVLALLAPWPPPMVGPPPPVVELVLAPPLSASAPAPAPPTTATTTTAAAEPAPPPPARPATAPKPRSRPQAQAAATPATPTPTAPMPTGSTQPPAAAVAAAPSPFPSSAPGRGAGNGANGNGGALPPGYTLGDAHTPVPDYPWSARRRGVEGRVVLRLEVDADGRPTAVDLVHSSGDAALDKAAITTLWHWRLRPAVAGGMPVAGAVVVPILFKLT